MRTASNVAAAFGIALAVFGLGGVHTSVAVGCAAAMVAAAVLGMLAAGSRGARPVTISAVGLAACAAAALAALQLIPMPEVVHALLNPVGQELTRAGLELSGFEWHGYRPLSMDPGATGDRAVRLAALAGAALWAANVSGRHAWLRFATWFIPLALAALAVGAALFLTHAESFLGYAPRVGFRGPSIFVSTNHGAVFYGLAALIAGAAMLGCRRTSPRRAAAFGVASLVLGAPTLALDSDGVYVALALAGVTAAGVWWARHLRGRVVAREIKVALALLGGLAVVAAIWLALPRVLWSFFERVVFSGEHGGRLELLRAGTHAVLDYWRFGAGAGAVETVLPHYVDWSALLPASIPLIENDPLELMLSFGIPFGAAVVAATLLQVGKAVRPGLDPRRRPRYAVALVSAVYFGIVAQLHFPMFALGIAVPAIVWFELLWSRRSPASPADRRWLATGHAALTRRAGIVLCGALAIVAAGGAAAHFGAYAPPRGESVEELRREIVRRPASHVAFVKLATAAARQGDHARAVRLADHAVTREPSPRVRLYRARILTQGDAAAGAAAFGELFAEGHASRPFVQGFATSVRDTELRADVLADYPVIWRAVAEEVLRRDGPEPASSLVVALATRRPDDVEVYRLASQIYLAMKQPVLAELWARLAAEVEQRDAGGESIAPLLLARALSASGRKEEARRILDTAVDDPGLVRDAHLLALELRGPPDSAAAEFVGRHYAHYCVSPIATRDQRICWLTEAWIEETRGAYADAERALIRVRRRFDETTPLAEFYMRREACDALVTLARSVEPGPGRDRLELMARACVASNPAQ